MTDPNTGGRGLEPGRQDKAYASSILFSGAPTFIVAPLASYLASHYIASSDRLHGNTSPDRNQ
jgi:hypothetical protein